MKEKLNKKNRIQEIDRVVTEDRMCQKVAFEILVHRCPNLTIKEAKQIAMDMSVQLRNTIFHIKEEGLSLTDAQANSESFWIDQIENAGKNFNQKP